MADFPSIPSLPAIDDARAPNAVARDWLKTQLGQLPGTYAPMVSQAKLGTQHALAGYGGWSMGGADGMTPTYNANAPTGERQKGAIRGETNAANAHGLLYSSFANQNIGQAVTKLNEEARQIVYQGANQVNSILADQARQGTDIVSQYVQLYGSDSQWLVQNPPPTPPAPPVVGSNPAPLTNAAAGASNLPGTPGGIPNFARSPVLANMYPGQSNAPKPKPPTYAEFVRTHGGHSTAKLAETWKKTFG